MPELPEVETIRRGLESQIVGAKIQNVEIIDFPEVLENFTIGQFRDIVISRAFTGVRRRGKYLLLDLNHDLAIMVHLRMTGQLLVELSSALPTRFERLRFALDDDRELRFADQRKFGRVAVFTPEDFAALDKKLGFEPLESAFTALWLESVLSRRTGSIKAVLLDQSTIAGVGNIYADEALFRSGIHPATPAYMVTSEQVHRLHRDLRHILRRSIDNRGTSFSSYRDSSGERGSNQSMLQVYGLGRGDHPCPRCGALLRCISVAGRSSHYCPACQPEPNPSSSGVTSSN